GGTPLVAPLIDTRWRFTPECEAAVRRWSDYDVVVFTSANAVRALERVAKHYELPWPVGNPVCYVIGPATAGAAAEAGLSPISIPDVRTQREFSAALKNLLADGRRRSVLCPVGNLAETALADELRDAGHAVTVCTCYDTVDCPIELSAWRDMFKHPYVALLFYSPSAVASLLRQWPDAAAEFPDTGLVVCIGKTTAQAARKAFARVVAADRPDGVVDTLCDVIAAGGYPAPADG
ncbi:MAG: uroporphyrinogen-III synthase, partial [Alicyclobacillus sp.]|nr:uroporphyrinogen-III synthase [Alicyclobacillus sp.]